MSSQDHQKAAHSDNTSTPGSNSIRAVRTRAFNSVFIDNSTIGSPRSTALALPSSDHRPLNSDPKEHENNSILDSNQISNASPAKNDMSDEFYTDMISTLEANHTIPSSAPRQENIESEGDNSFGDILNSEEAVIEANTEKDGITEAPSTSENAYANVNAITDVIAEPPSETINSSTTAALNSSKKGADRATSLTPSSSINQTRDVQQAFDIFAQLTADAIISSMKANGTLIAKSSLNSPNSSNVVSPKRALNSASSNVVSPTRALNSASSNVISSNGILPTSALNSASSNVISTSNSHQLSSSRSPANPKQAVAASSVVNMNNNLPATRSPSRIPQANIISSSLPVANTPASSNNNSLFQPSLLAIPVVRSPLRATNTLNPIPASSTALPTNNNLSLNANSTTNANESKYVPLQSYSTIFATFEKKEYYWNDGTVFLKREFAYANISNNRIWKCIQTKASLSSVNVSYLKSFYRNFYYLRGIGNMPIPKYKRDIVAEMEKCFHKTHNLLYCYPSISELPAAVKTAASSPACVTYGSFIPASFNQNTLHHQIVYTVYGLTVYNSSGVNVTASVTSPVHALVDGMLISTYPNLDGTFKINPLVQNASEVHYFVILALKLKNQSQNFDRSGVGLSRPPNSWLNYVGAARPQAAQLFSSFKLFFNDCVKSALVRYGMRDQTLRTLIDPIIAELPHLQEDKILERIVNDLTLKEIKCIKRITEIGSKRKSDDLESEGQEISLLCPLSMSRISFPGVSSLCSHFQCTDLKLNTKNFYDCYKSTLSHNYFVKCPLCAKNVNNKDNPMMLSIEFLTVLSQLKDSVQTVYFDDKGNFSEYKEGKKKEDAVDVELRPTTVVDVAEVADVDLIDLDNFTPKKQKSDVIDLDNYQAANFVYEDDTGCIIID